MWRNHRCGGTLNAPSNSSHPWVENSIIKSGENCMTSVWRAILNYRIHFCVSFFQHLIRGIKHVDHKSNRVVFETYGLNTNTVNVNLKSQDRHGINSTLSFYTFWSQMHMNGTFTVNKAISVKLWIKNASILVWITLNASSDQKTTKIPYYKSINWNRIRSIDVRDSFKI